jgi:hypothetical protein
MAGSSTEPVLTMNENPDRRQSTMNNHPTCQLPRDAVDSSPKAIVPRSESRIGKPILTTPVLKPVLTMIEHWISVQTC